MTSFFSVEFRSGRWDMKRLVEASSEEDVKEEIRRRHGSSIEISRIEVLKPTRQAGWEKGRGLKG